MSEEIIIQAAEIIATAIKTGCFMIVIVLLICAFVKIFSG